ncbi:ATP-grasp domain-containing protein [Saccharothrix coeruleofusca]|uniref:ATP-grasp domain-containing protein n=1 Tax=Saccharothrix coeruleofusca TaxID=33919 RepID=A0A918EGU3_9PSEU|nr:ATP-grasp domain-containing protein [Saccharothrix coeruleofusca]MBP2336007.1 biotin carboxylase [Saccharothrix coeruleofusca]GGP76044.1 hypothetical protein GCM10010185_57090 [Saccharothrix coeruleofusca]
MSGQGGTRRRETLLVVGSGYQLSNEPMFNQLATEADLVLLDSAPLTWQHRWVRDHEVFDPNDEGDALRLAKVLAGRNRIDAVCTHTEGSVLLAARLAEALSLPGLPVAAAELARDKHRQRQMLAATGLSPTRSVLVHDLDAARAAAAQIGFPLVVKPRGLSGSAGVCRVDDPADFDAAFLASVHIDKKGMASEGTLIEEYIDGEEFAVDFWVVDGVATPVSWYRYVMGYDQHPIQIGYIAGNGALTEPATTDGFELARRAVLAAGMDRTVAHVEIKLSSRGPRVIELNGRPPGDISSLIVEVARGVRMGGLLAAAALGREPERREVRDHAAGCRFLYPRGRQRFDGLAPAPELRSRPWVYEVGELRPRGDIVAPPPEDLYGRVGYVMATGPDADEVADRLALATHELEVLGPLV